MKTFRRLLLYFGRYRVRALAAIGAMAIVSLSAVAMLYLVGRVFDDALGAGTAESFGALRGAAASKSGPLLRWLDEGYAAARRAAEARGISVRFAVPVLLFVALFSKSLFSYFSEFELNGIGVAMVRDLRRDAYRRLLYQSTRFYSQGSTGDLMSRMLSDVEQIQHAFGHNLTDLVQGFLTLLLLLVYVFSLDARLALLVFALAPFVLLPIVNNTRRLGRAATATRERIGEMGALLSETLRANPVIKTYAMEAFEEKRFEDVNEAYFRANRKTVRIQALNSPLMETLAGVGLASLFVYAAARIHAGAMTPGDLLTFLAALMMMYKPLKDITRINMAVQLALSSARRIFDLMDRQSEIVEKPGAPELPPFAGEIRYERVSFAYAGDPVLRDVTLTIRRGETVAIVGPSGAGKTTLVSLLPRLYDPTAGSITVDGMDLRDARLASLRRQIAVVTQETILFDSSARDNIAYGQTSPPEERVREAARGAYAEEFVEALPSGYDTRLGQDAGRLSGGQRQRLAIARALYKNAPILILDEATSQLDSESEALVARAFANLMRDRTTLVIAHRLSTVRRADRIVVLDGGRIVEEGTHRELLTRPGLYRRLHDMQFFAGEDEFPGREQGSAAP
ncbi:MAG TPA: ABC transporter ATP-binding protein [Thermoanaerobaculia bacterium]|nr:ABC transporter ATP-binding protein [Thermoanaerobaculia bacterium]